jgi:uncharacterized coiled-coil DUF342 family protein
MSDDGDMRDMFVNLDRTLNTLVQERDTAREERDRERKEVVRLFEEKQSILEKCAELEEKVHTLIAQRDQVNW